MKSEVGKWKDEVEIRATFGSVGAVNRENYADKPFKGRIMHRKHPVGNRYSLLATPPSARQA